jgi:hypothetical protein
MPVKVWADLTDAEKDGVLLALARHVELVDEKDCLIMV